MSKEWLQLNPKDFGNYLRSLRKDANLTMRKLDALSGVSHSYISQLERGERGIPSPDILKKLADPLGVQYGELMHEAGYFGNQVSLDDEGKVILHEIPEKYHNDDLNFVRLVIDGKVLRGDDALDYLRAQGLIHGTIEEVEEAGKKADELEMIHILDKDITLYGHKLTKEERKRVEQMLDLMFPHYLPKS